MKKTKKKKNLKLRRSIRKTIASLIMVMAIVVAAIPVENYGTMQAAHAADAKSEVDSDYSSNYTSGSKTDLYDKAYYETNADTGFNGNTVLIQRIENSTITTMFKAQKKSNAQTNTTAMITEYTNPEIDASVTINSSENYQYIVMTDEYLARVNDKFSGEKYNAEFEKTTVRSYTATNGLQAFELKKIDSTVTYSAVGYATGATSGYISYTSNSNSFVDLKSTVEADYVRDLYNSAKFKTYLTAAQNAISNYNNKVSSYQTQLDAIYNAASPVVADWDNLITTINNELSTYDHLSMAYTDFTSTKYNNLTDIQDYTICHRLTNNNNKDLSNYELIECISNGDVDGDGVSDDGKAVYVPRDSSGSYLAEGTVTITGIAAQAFSRNKTSPSNTLSGITIPSTVTFIGAEAFMGQSKLSSVTVNDSNCKVIGDRAFSGCSSINSFAFGSASSGASAIDIFGNHAFENTGSLGTSDKAFQVPASVTQIGIGCFHASGIVNLSFAENQGAKVTLEKYAFKDCTQLEKVTFPSKKKFVIMKGAFSCGNGNGSDLLENFSYPSSMTELYSGTEDDYDYCLAGRENLKNVVLPDSLGKGTNYNKIPDNTFGGCAGLKSVTFPDNAGYAKYESDVFKDVTNEEFVVIGPEYKAGTTDYAQPRQSAWDAVFSPNGSSGTVPYQYTNAKGTHLEIGDGDYIKSIDVKDTTYAILSNFNTKPGKEPSAMIPLEVPTKVGSYIIDEIATGFLGDKVKDKIYKVIVNDGTVKRINAGAFQDCSELQWVELGDSVTYIGSLAFGNCPKLENVVFSQTQASTWGPNDSYWSDLKIEDDAFKTESQLLTFHGAINPNYRPYVIASNKNNTTKSELTGSGNEICYKTDAPLNLTVIKDRGTQKMTLIDYPHYEEIDYINVELRKELGKKFKDAGIFNGGVEDYSIIKKFEYLSNLTPTNTEYSGFSALENIETQIVRQTLELEIPEGVESIDAKGFLTNTGDNSTSIDGYFSKTYTEDKANGKFTSSTIDRHLDATSPSSTTDVKKLYALNKLDENNGETVTPGLFSGFFRESNIVSTNGTPASTPSAGILWRTYNGHNYVENNKRGNDYLTNVNLDSVQSLPDYAFDSNENILSASFGAEMNEIGALPFKDCKSMYQINITGNTKYSFENMILYEDQSAGKTRASSTGLKIVECLEGRGAGGNYSNGVIDTTSNPLLSSVSEIAEGAFSNCDLIKSIDLSTSSVKTIPVDTFSGCAGLTEVMLPKTVSRIDDGSFSGLGDYITVSIPNPLCVISDKIVNADDKTEVVIKGIQYVNESTGETSPCYESYLQLEKAYPDKFTFRELGSTCTVEFVNSMDNMSTIKAFEIDKGASVEAVPTAPAISGYKFSQWLCKVGDKVYTDEAAYSNVTEDRVVIAMYESDPSEIASDGKTYTLTISGGTGFAVGSNSTIPVTSLNITGGTTVTLIYTEVSGASFKTWSASGSDGKDYSSLLGSVTSSITSFKMPNSNVTVTATNTNGSSSSDGSTSNGSNSGSSSDSSNKTKYKVTVNYGTGSGEYAEGDTVTISANTPDSTSKVFSKWTTDNTSVAFASATSSSTTFKMPASAVVVTANYKTKSSADDDDDEESSSSRRPTSSTTTVNTSTNNSANTANGTNTSTTTGTVSQSGEDKLYITKNGVSNKDVGSAQVDGSTDNFVVKISESAEATAAVEEALRNRYGSLDGLAYFPMDISLYDASGKNKIEDTYGLNVTVTMPIPDVLVQYGGNARAAAADNGYLTELNVRFTTIDGIACMSFVPPHFSPYVIYVDTNNLVAGQTTDATPKTGDPIHPKWFLAIGMAGLSVLLFVTGDTKKKRKVKMA